MAITDDRKCLERNREVFDIARKKIFGENERGLSTSGHAFPSQDYTASGRDHLASMVEVINAAARIGILDERLVHSFTTVAEVTAFFAGGNAQCPCCKQVFQHPPFNNLLLNCPYCGAQLAVTSATPSRFVPNSSVNDLPATIQMRCPGGCGSLVDAHRFDAAGDPGPVISPCDYSCKVRLELWNKKVEEAKRK